MEIESWKEKQTLASDYLISTFGFNDPYNSKIVLTFYITLFNVPLRLVVRENDNIDELVARFLYTCTRNL